MSSTALFLILALTPPQELDRAALAEVVEPYLEEHGVPGAVIALVVDGAPGAVEAFGLADVAAKTPMTPATRFQVGSVTKPVTATLVALLAEEGLLAYDDPVAAHLPDGVALPAELASITLRQLMTHSSGLPREPKNRVDLPDTPSVMAPMSTAQLFEGLSATELEPEPRAAWAYSNLGYALLGALAGEAAGERYDRLVHARVLSPLGMSKSAVHVDEDAPQGLATCYWPEDGEPVAREPWRFGTACAFSGLVSTAGDLSRFLAAQMDTGENALFSEETRAFLHAPAVTIDPDRGRAMAPGWFIDPLPGGLVAVGHGGEVDGHSAVLAFFPDLRAGIVVLCNQGDKAAEELTFALMEVVLRRLSR